MGAEVAGTTRARQADRSADDVAEPAADAQDAVAEVAVDARPAARMALLPAPVPVELGCRRRPGSSTSPIDRPMRPRARGRRRPRPASTLAGSTAAARTERVARPTGRSVEVLARASTRRTRTRGPTRGVARTVQACPRKMPGRIYACGGRSSARSSTPSVRIAGSRAIPRAFSGRTRTASGARRRRAPRPAASPSVGQSCSPGGRWRARGRAPGRVSIRFVFVKRNPARSIGRARSAAGVNCYVSLRAVAPLAPSATFLCFRSAGRSGPAAPFLLPRLSSGRDRCPTRGPKGAEEFGIGLAMEGSEGCADGGLTGAVFFWNCTTRLKRRRRTGRSHRHGPNSRGARIPFPRAPLRPLGGPSSLRRPGRGLSSGLCEVLCVSGRPWGPPCASWASRSVLRLNESPFQMRHKKCSLRKARRPKVCVCFQRTFSVR